MTPLIVEQTYKEMQDSGSFNRRSEIVGVNIVGATMFTSAVQPMELQRMLQVHVQYTLLDISQTADHVRAITNFECKIVEILEEDSTTEDPIAQFECALVGTYKLLSNDTPTETELKAFHKGNAVFNCWPYFREFVQSSASRMGIPPPPIPFLRVHTLPEDSIKEPVRAEKPGSQPRQSGTKRLAAKAASVTAKGQLSE